ncbi:MAG: M14 family zinc carboxypeptidase [Bacteroidota bacterium]
MMKYICLPLLFCLFACQNIDAQSSLITDIEKQYDQYKEPTITHQRFKHRDVVPLIEKRRSDDAYDIRELGQSVEGRSIYGVAWGKGATKVLLWSQMHGNEPTATMAIFDLFNFLEANDEFDDLRQMLSEKLSLFFIPMLNPDGAEVFKRQTALDVDMNRDALRLQQPESRILKEVQQRVMPDWGFNLHDQSRYYAAGYSDKPATVSFLAPAYDVAKNINEKREDAMQLIALMNATLQEYIPGQVAKYDDTFEPRAFGDNIQKWGTRTILIEAGGQYDDLEKQYNRRLHFITFLSAFEAIANGDYEKYSTKAYDEIPFNRRSLYDLILRQVKVPFEDETYTVDLAFNRSPRKGEENVYYEGQFAYVGDMSTNHGYKELTANGYTLEWGKVHPTTFETVLDAGSNGWSAFHRQGYTHARVLKIPPADYLEEQPIHFISMNEQVSSRFALWTNPTFFLVKNGRREFMVRNGRLFDLR